MSGFRSLPSRDIAPPGAAISDVYVTRFSNPHTAIPDWLLLTRSIRLEARNMAAVIIILSKRGIPPSKQEIADTIGVEARTVQRWLAELAAAGVMSYQLVGRRRMYVFHEAEQQAEQQANPDRGITDRGITDRGITDRHAISDPPISDPPISHASIDQHRDMYGPSLINRYSQENPITDRSGGGGDHDLLNRDSPTGTNPRTRTKVRPADITTDTGRWLVDQVFSLTSAYKFQNIPLDVAQADYARRRSLGQNQGGIINAWSVELPQVGGELATDGGAYGAAGMADLRAKYGDLFKLGSDLEGFEEEES